MSANHSLGDGPGIGDRIGTFRIVRLLGEGGMGSVFEALHETIERRVAIKLLRPTFAQDPLMVQRFFNEARAVNRIEHPSIVQVSDFGHAHDGTAYLVMELLRGETLSRRLARLATQRETMSPLTALQIAWQVSDALTAAHERHIVHRDLKPDNLMLVADPIAPGGERVKLLDFGIAKLAPENPQEVSELRTDTRLLMGAPAYMSPEQCAGAGGVDAKADVYSLGIVLYRMLSGQVPFMADGAGQIIAMHLFKEPPPLSSVAPQVPLDIAALVHRLLIKDRNLRPSMPEARAELGMLLSTVSNPSASLPGRLSGAAPLHAMEPTRSSLPSMPSHESLPRPSSATFDKAQGQKEQRGAGRGLRILGIAGSASLLILAALKAMEKPTAPNSSTAPLKAAGQSTTQSPTKPTSKNTTPDTKPSPAQKPAAMIRWQVTSDPPGADVTDVQGAFMGQTPWTQEQESAPGNATIVLRKDGYQTTSVMLKQDQSFSRHISLQQLSKKRASKPAPASHATKSASRNRPGSKAKGIPLED